MMPFVSAEYSWSLEKLPCRRSIYYLYVLGVLVLILTPIPTWTAYFLRPRSYCYCFTTWHLLYVILPPLPYPRNSQGQVSSEDGVEMDLCCLPSSCS